MNTSDLRRILSTYRCVAPLFAGVLPRDRFVELVRVTRRDYVAVFNTQASRQPGEHWIAYIRLNGHGRYFDSYSCPPDAHPDMAAALLDSRPSGGLIWNGERLQGLTTTACGDYCLLFALLTCRGWSLHRFIGTLSRACDFEQRDHGVRATVLRLYSRNAIATLRVRSSDDDEEYVGCD